MDLSFSPDVDAWICYLILVVISVWVAVRQVNKRLGAVDGVWYAPETWALLTLYVAVPVLLFWFLDRTQAVFDSSLIAAVIIAFGYERIMTGNSKTITAPGPVTDFWTPFLAFADEVTARVRFRLARTAGREADQLVAKVSGHADLYAALEGVVKRRASDPAALQSALEDIAKQKETIGKSGVEEKSIRRLYGELITLPDYRALLRSSKILTWSELNWARIRGMLKLGAGVFLGLLIAGAAVKPLGLGLSDIGAKYHLWRLAKTHSSLTDQNRAQSWLFSTMHDDSHARSSILGPLMALLRDPSLPTDRADSVQQTILAARENLDSGEQARLGCQLAESLRTRNVDIRARIQRALQFLGPKPDPKSKLDQDGQTKLANWRPTDGDSITDIERYVDVWTAWFGLSSGCQPPPSAP